MQLYLRDALPADIDGLLALLSGGRLVEGDDSPINLPADMASFVDAIREIDRTDGTYLMVADLGGRLVGMLQLITFRHLQHRGGRCAEIESMHVASDMRGQGVGGRLLDHAVRRACELGCYRVQLTSNVDRPDAHHFYEAHDFVPSHKGYKRYLKR
ncbi:MAG: GNAT family N-acetyltransferase [Ilumatobacteraceae bacterium]|nr:GNAT family N-acetyltransferase [Ilumatobacteraceae bacterium]